MQGPDNSIACDGYDFDRDLVIMNYVYGKCLSKGIQPTEEGLEEFVEDETGCALVDKTKLPSQGRLEVYSSLFPVKKQGDENGGKFEFRSLSDLRLDEVARAAQEELQGLFFLWKQ